MKRYTTGNINATELKKLIGKDNPIILDIGCNDGEHTLWFLNLFREARVYCFEPDLRAINRFKDKVKNNRAKLFEIAISDNDGETYFYVSDGINPPDLTTQKFPEGWDLSGSIKKPKKHLKIFPWVKFERKVKVTTKRLDKWCREENIRFIDLIWADVQGAEIDLIKGGLSAIKNTRYFYTEYSNLELYEGQINLQKLMKLLPDFEIVYRYANDVLLRNKKFA